MKYCHKCGARVEETHQFCRSCGQDMRTAATPPAPARDFRFHVRLLAILLMVTGGLGLLGALGMFLLAGPMAGVLRHAAVDPIPMHFVPGLMVGLGWFFAALALATLVAGFGLLDYQSWARPLAVVISVLLLLKFPWGTALGVYGLWVLLSEGGARHYYQRAQLHG